MVLPMCPHNYSSTMMKRKLIKKEVIQGPLISRSGSLPAAVIEDFKRRELFARETLNASFSEGSQPVKGGESVGEDAGAAHIDKNYTRDLRKRWISSIPLLTFKRGGRYIQS